MTGESIAILEVTQMKSHGYAPMLIFGVFLCLATVFSAFAKVPYHQSAVFDFDGDGISDPVVIEDVNNGLNWTIMSRDPDVCCLLIRHLRTFAMS